MSASYAFTPIPPSRASLARRPNIVRDLSGTWRGQMLATDADVSTPFTLLRDTSADSAVIGRFLFFSTPQVAPTGVRLLEASYSTFVAMVGPYYDPSERADVVTVLEGRRNEGRLSGTFTTRLVRGMRTVRTGRFVASRQDSAAK